MPVMLRTDFVVVVHEHQRRASRAFGCNRGGLGRDVRAGVRRGEDYRLPASDEFPSCGGLTRMGKLTYGMNVSVDGYIADTNGDIGWSDPDAELHQYWNDQVRDTAVSLYGRKLYELMSAHWPTADEAPDVSSVQAEFARLWRAMPKVVFSKTLDSVGWNSRLERGDVVEVATRLKAETDGL